MKPISGWLAGGLPYFMLRSVVVAGVERPRPTITYHDGVSTRDETKDWEGTMSATEEKASQDIPYDIFLSYARHDKEQAQLVFDALGRQGWSVFMDKEIPNAERWEQYLKQQLGQVPCVLVLWSPAARESSWVQLEASVGRERQVLVHVTLDGKMPPGDFSGLQANNLSTWDGRGDDPEFLRVLRAVAMKVGTKATLGTLRQPTLYEEVTEDHLALTSTSWRRDGEKGRGPFPYQIHLRLVGSQAALQRVENVVYYFDPAYGQNRPDLVDPVQKAYVQVSTDWRSGFTVYDLANGYSVVRAAVKVRDQARIVKLSRLVDIMEKGPWLKNLYPIWPEE